MSQKVFYHRYALHSEERLNVKSARRKHEGVLIRVGEGVGCIHPWEVFGDEAVEVQLRELSKGRFTRLSKNAFDCAQLDAEARERGLSLFDGLQVPLSHATVGENEDVEALIKAGFTKLKIKAGSNVERDAERANTLASRFPEVQLRIDFNCNFRGDQVGDFVELLSEQTRSQIDFLEDPCSYKDGCWTGLRKLYGIRLAMDIGVEEVAALYSYAVIKPAKNKVRKIAEDARAHGRRCVVTSYMDHPIGQAYAAYQAGMLDAHFLGVCDHAGLMTHGLFEANAFSEKLGTVQPQWPSIGGTGLGFDELLESLEWTELS